MSFVVAVLIVCVPVAVSLFFVKRAREINRSRGRWGTNRQGWLALAAFFLLFAAENVGVLIFTGDVFKYLVLVIPVALLGAIFLYIALNTPNVSINQGGA